MDTGTNVLKVITGQNKNCWV